MMEAVFSDSACGALKVAQHLGKGPYPGAAHTVILSSKRGLSVCHERSKLKIEAALSDRLAWEQAEPFGGNPADVYGLCSALSMGGIQGDLFGPERLAFLIRLYGIFPDGEQVASDLLHRSAENFHALLHRARQGEPVRIWYSDQPDEQCGLCWLLFELDRIGCSEAAVLVKLPALQARSDGSVIRHLCWGDVEPAHWASYLPLQTKPPKPVVRALVQLWRELQQGNAPLRAAVNGRLLSVPADFYDFTIRREIASQPEMFQQAMVIGRVLGTCQLGISDAWIAQRMEEMIHRGELTPVDNAPADSPFYHRILKKTSVF